MNSRALLRSPRGAQAGTLTLPCYEQQITAEKTNRSRSWHTTLPCHEQQSTAEKKPKRCPRVLVHSWCISGALLVHSWCTLVHFLVHFWCTPGALLSRKGTASLPKGSLDPPHRNVWIAFSCTYKPERELHRFRKEASILCTETFGSCQLANPKGNCPASERKS